MNPFWVPDDPPVVGKRSGTINDITFLASFIRQAGSAASKNEKDESSLMEVVNLANVAYSFARDLLVIIESYIKQLWKNILHA